MRWAFREGREPIKTQGASRRGGAGDVKEEEGGSTALKYKKSLKRGRRRSCWVPKPSERPEGKETRRTVFLIPPIPQRRGVTSLLSTFSPAELRPYGEVSGLSLRGVRWAPPEPSGAMAVLQKVTFSFSVPRAQTVADEDETLWLCAGSGAPFASACA